MGDLNLEVSENCLNGFCHVNSLKNFNRGATCSKSSNNPLCIDLFLTNQQQCFQKTHAIETGISDFHRMVVTVMNTHYKKQKPKTIQNRNYKHFYEQSFNFKLNNELMKIGINNAELKEFNKFFNMLQENRNILELIILIISQKLFGKKFYTNLDFARNFW